VNNRGNGSLFHYAHFICDCLYPEVINKLYNFQTIYRNKTLDQTLGNFSKIYEEVMKNKSIELPSKDFKKTNTPFILPRKENYKQRKHMVFFRKYIFARYNIRPFKYIGSYPEVLLVKRGERIDLIQDESLKNINKNVSTGAERREIKRINWVENFLKRKYANRFTSMFLETQPFEEQVKLFNNAKLIVLAHGAAMSNMFFCKKNTTIVEVTCKRRWGFFNVISNNLELNPT
jgi:hypothetical protein